MSFAATKRAVTAIELGALESRLSRTDVINRAVQVYTYITVKGFWFALLVLIQERRQVRKFRKEGVYNATET